MKRIKAEKCKKNWRAPIIKWTADSVLRKKQEGA